MKDKLIYWSLLLAPLLTLGLFFCDRIISNIYFFLVIAVGNIVSIKKKENPSFKIIRIEYKMLLVLIIFILLLYIPAFLLFNN
ncbi:hypothetical protein AAEX28_15685 [Lentisphaerota bacterium WC36G]|nr:hypothetical protein LJT99_02445 [Lentisphaerae bacterium WC36]